MSAFYNSMESVGNKVIVRFDESHNKVFKIGDVEIMKPDIWQYNAGESDDRMEGKVNKLLINPQVAEVVINNKKNKLAKGDKVFVHYMAYEWKDDNAIDIKGVKCAMIDGGQVFFKIVEGELITQPDIFLGELIHEDKMTMSGIIISVSNVRRASTIKITHKPKEVKKETNMIEVGMTVNTVDDNQYIVNYNGKDYVVLKSNEIAGITQAI